MSLLLNILSVLIVVGFFIYIVIKSNKNITVLILTILIMLTLLSQIALDEVVRFKMIAVESIDDITNITEIVQWIDIVKALLIFILAAYYFFVNAKLGEEEDRL